LCWYLFFVSQLSYWQVLRNLQSSQVLYPLVLFRTNLNQGTINLFLKAHPFIFDALFNTLLLPQWNEEVIVQVHYLPLIQEFLIWFKDLRLLLWKTLYQFIRYAEQVVELLLQDLFWGVIDHFQSLLKVLEEEQLKSLDRSHQKHWFYSIAIVMVICYRQLVRTFKPLDQFTVD